VPVKQAVGAYKMSNRLRNQGVTMLKNVAAVGGRD
jgi:hypothetical protein